MHKSIAVIPARGGSKSIPKKNLQLVGEKTLIERAVVAALSSECFEQVIVSTDCDEIAYEAKRFGASVPYLRSPALSTDDALTVDVIKDVISKLPNGGSNYSDITLLQPTSPFRTKTHILEAFFNFRSGNYDSLVSVVDVRGNHPFRMKRIVEGSLISYIDQGFEDMRPRQILPKVYIRNGAIYIVKLDYLSENHSLVGGKVGYYLMNEIESVNIDGQIDLAFSNFLVNSAYLND